MDSKFSIQLDGQEAQMIINALQEKADRMQTPQVARMYRLLARRVTEGKVSFHSSSYQIMAGRYGLPVVEVSNNAIPMEQFGGRKGCYLHGCGPHSV